MPPMSKLTMSPEDFDARYQPQTPMPADAPPQLIPPRNEMARSPVMLASLPGTGSSPDAILRQHLGGRTSSGGRFL